VRCIRSADLVFCRIVDPSMGSGDHPAGDDDREELRVVATTYNKDNICC
jgi:hypothetical protein